MTVLIAVLTLACLIVGISLVVLNHRNEKLPASSVADILSVLKEENITIDPSLISAKRQNGRVYVCDSGDYNHTVASLLGQNDIKSAYAIPNGEIVLLKNGARVDFSTDFSFHYYLDGEPHPEEDFDPDGQVTSVSEQKKAEIAETVIRFLDRGSRSFENASDMELETSVNSVWEKNGVFYAFCTRTIGGADLKDNNVICAVYHGEVSEAYGTWSFLTSGDTYSVRLVDTINILFNAKKQIAMQEHGDVVIESVESCYSLYSYGKNEALCLIPCRLIRTNCMGDYLFNAIDGTLCTK